MYIPNELHLFYTLISYVQNIIFDIIVSLNLRSPKWLFPSRHTDILKLRIIPWRREAVYLPKRRYPPARVHVIDLDDQKKILVREGFKAHILMLSVREWKSLNSGVLIGLMTLYASPYWVTWSQGLISKGGKFFRSTNIMLARARKAYSCVLRAGSLL